MGIFSNRLFPEIRRVGFAALVASAIVSCRADSRVIVSSSADSEYTRRKYGGAQPCRETYVVMQGHYFEGASVDRSIERMKFRQIVDVFAPELGRDQYFPAANAREADLLIVVHWGTTRPRALQVEEAGHSSPTVDTSGADTDRQRRIGAASENGEDPLVSRMWELGNESALLQQNDMLDQRIDEISVQQSAANAAQLLGYTKELRRLGQRPGGSTEEETLFGDLAQERYFIILKAYDLHGPVVPGRSRRAVWTVHLNMSSPGNNFGGAIVKMSATAVNFLGRTTDGIQTVTPRLLEGRVEIGPTVILGEVK